MKLKINGKMLLYLLGTTVLVYIAALGFISMNLRNISFENSQKRDEAIAIDLTNEAKRKLDPFLETASTIAKIFSNYNHIPETERRAFYSEVLKDVLKENPKYSSVWSILESNSIDNFDEQFKNKTGSTILGNFNYTYYRNNDSILLSDYIEKDSTKVFNGQIYNQVKNSASELVIDPYYYLDNQNNSDEILHTNMVAPIIKNNIFLGVIGVDASLSNIQEEFSKQKPLNTGRTYIITSKGSFFSHPDSTYLGKKFETFAPEIELEFNVLEKLSNGESFSFFATEPLTNENSLFIFKPLQIGSCKDSWSFCISIPASTIYKSANRTFKSTIIIGFIGLLIVSIVIGVIAFSISGPLVKTTLNLKRIAEGNIAEVKRNKAFIKDEISDMGEAMDNLVKGLTSAAEFAHEIGKGNLEAKYKLLSKNDVLGNSLITMQQRLIVAKKDEEQKRIIDEKRNWVTHGLATFGEIIRQHNDDMDKFSLNVIDNLMKYTNAAQIAIYINQQIEDDDFSEESYDLKAAMTYGKQVMMQKSFKRGEELLGRAVDENKILYFKEIPENYVYMSQGMQNKKRPQYLLITPLSINNLSLGVFELLFYDEIETHYIEFIEKLSENIASVISSVKTNIRTAKLLEQSQHQADELAQHEEEMRQNLEEMQATQEEATKRYNSLNSHVKALSDGLMFAELDKTARVKEMTAPMRAFYSSNNEKTKGVFFDSLTPQGVSSKNDFDEFFENVLANGMGKRMRALKRRNKDIWMLETYKVIEKDGAPIKVVVYAENKTEEKALSEKLN